MNETDYCNINREYGNLDLSVQYFLNRRVKKEAMILDIGANIGSFLNSIYCKGYQNIYGVDIRKASIEYGIKKYPQIKARLKVYDGTVLPFADNYFDIVTMFDVIEHVPDPDRFLKEVCRVLKPNGVLIFQTPNKYINTIWESILWRSLWKWRKEHCSLQSIFSLNRLLKGYFTTVKVEKFKLDTEFNRWKLKDRVGIAGVLLINVAQYLPLVFFPNLWGTARLPKSKQKKRDKSAIKETINQIR